MASENQLADSLRSLQIFAGELAQRVNNPSREPQQYLTNLQKVVNALGHVKPARSIYCPEEYVKQWKDFQEDQTQQLQRRAIRYLCWQPDVATSQPFQYFLDHNHIDLNARSLQGLVRSCHARWSPEFAKGQVVSRVRDRLNTYGGTNPLLSQWKQGSGVILGLRGAEEFGAEMVETLRPIKQHCESWGIADETSAYVQVAVRHAAEVCRNQMDRVPDLGKYLLQELLPWTGWPLHVFKDEASKVILHAATTQAVDVRESVRLFALNDPRLGDPRLQHNRLNWAGIGEAERRVIEWLSQFDIVFFFESVLPLGKDPHGRKDFWLRYVSRVVRSRPLLNLADKSRLRAGLKQTEWELLNFGDMTAINTSAFVLDFGRVIAVEFSAVGNACYLYEKSKFDELVPNLYTTKPFDLYKLKQRRLSFKQIIHRKAKRGGWRSNSWEEPAADVLRQFDIRPR